MRDRYVIADYEDTCHALGLEARTLAEAEQAISWQRRGGFTTPFHICTYDRDTRGFVAIGGSTFVPVNGSFTEQAWQRFMSEVDPAAAEAGVFGIETAPTP